MKVICEECGKEFESKRSTAKYCSGACKMKLARKKNVFTLPVTQEKVVEEVATHVKKDKDYYHLYFEECDGSNCPGGFVPNKGAKEFRLRTAQEALKRVLE